MSEVTIVDSENRVDELYNQEYGVVETTQDDITEDMVIQSTVEEKAEIVASKIIHTVATKATQAKEAIANTSPVERISAERDAQPIESTDSATNETAQPPVTKAAEQEMVEVKQEKKTKTTAGKAMNAARKALAKTASTTEAMVKKMTKSIKKTIIKRAKKASNVQPSAQKDSMLTTGLPTVNLVNLTRQEIQEKDPTLVAVHIPEYIQTAQWDEVRNVVVIKKSGKERAYKLNQNAAPALIEGQLSDVIAYLNKM